MTVAGDIVDDVLEIIHRKEEPEMAIRVWRILNREYFDICASHSWKLLRKSPLSLDFSAADSTGLYLPSNILGIDMVRDNNADFQFLPRDASAADEPDDEGYRFYTYMPESTSLHYGQDANMEPGDAGIATFTSAGLTTAGTTVTDQYARFGNEPGLYKISNTATPFAFAPTYFGPSLSDADFHIRPKETLKMIILDPSEEKLLDRTVKVWCWEAPQPLYKPSDMIVLPSARPLHLRVLKALPEAKVHRPVSDREIKEAMDEALQRNPDFPREAKPRNRQNEAFDTSVNPFARR